ncbi:MAG TPA: tRNA pseudouridine(55) synthase TruB [Candidatus Saccharimonadales bacterium]|nr:tRNA pseudouridine(55) synthase TruB [Candidatus Saccharimonadales bacterium]
MQGILLIDKPADWTSFDAVNYIRKQVAMAESKKPKAIKVGHTGTLDPFATGLLILLIGKAYTRRAGEFSKLDKTYEVTMQLGASSNTGDPEGQIELINGRQPDKLEIQKALGKFVGLIDQIPPAYSAIKIEGQRAYHLARTGQQVDLKPRQVKVNSLKLISYDYPAVKLIADVSTGTYIRALVEDIGKNLGVGAYTRNLRRIKIGKFKIKESEKLSPNLIDAVKLIE